MISRIALIRAANLDGLEPRIDAIKSKAALEANEKRVTELEADLTIARLQLARIADEVFDPAKDVDEMRVALQNIRYIINPAM